MESNFSNSNRYNRNAKTQLKTILLGTDDINEPIYFTQDQFSIEPFQERFDKSTMRLDFYNIKYNKNRENRNQNNTTNN
jgi:hypothetical protein